MVKRALLVIDVQQEYFTGALPIAHPTGTLPRILAAMDAARANGILTVVVQHVTPLTTPPGTPFREDGPGAAVHPDVASRHRDALIVKRMPGSFTGTSLEQLLRQHGVTTVVIAGYMTHMCCDTTARQAYHMGMQVEFLSDATGTPDLENAAGRAAAADVHRVILVAQQSHFSQVMTTEQWLQAIRS
eukprot:m51a1_g3491 putative isochorismatase hydrolase (187) ;mRNA; f:796037-796597